MTSAEFLNEVLLSGVGPDNFSEIYKNFRGYQDLALQTLIEFNKICKENGITYVLAYGSLLGAVRDNSQIPWDYDVDVFVPFEEREKLVKVLKKKLSSDYYFICPEVDSKCRHTFIRIAPKGYRTEELHVDIFYLTGTPPNFKEIKPIAKKITKLSKLRYIKLVDASYACYGRSRSLIKLILLKAKYLNKSYEKAHLEYLEICNRYKAKDSKYNITADTFSHDHVYEGNDIWNTLLIDTDVGQFPIPLGYEAILSQTYGDYRTLPSLENRIKEVFNHYERLSMYAKI